MVTGCQSQQEKCFNCNGYGHRSYNCNNPTSPNPNQGKRRQPMNAMSGVNLIQPTYQQAPQQIFQQMQQPINQQLPPIVQQPSVQTHPGMQCHYCNNMGHISGTCPYRPR